MSLTYIEQRKDLPTRYMTTSRVHWFCAHGSLTNRKPTFLSSRGK